MERKVCSKCKRELPLDAFAKNKSEKDGLQKRCTECRKEDYRQNREKILERNKAYRQNNKEKCAEADRKYREKNKDRIHERQKIWRQNNKEKLREKMKQYNEIRREELKEYREKNKDIIHEKAKIWRQNNAEYLKEKKREYVKNNKEKVDEWRKTYKEKNREQIRENWAEYNRKRREEDELYAFVVRMRTFIRNSFLRTETQKKNKTFDIIGMDRIEFRDYLYNTFYKNYGYEYDGKEEVHIDHIVPLATAKTEEDVIKLCHYTNLQLLKPKDNLYKKDRLDFELPIPPLP